ncbi:MAG: hypothetical protein DRP74_07315 [Candidatus Omnitrophota bacterium]|nr:MAG: hypothetical protein DRP74_07315 [Candidatus Omnitrophota bacterium]
MGKKSNGIVRFKLTDPVRKSVVGRFHHVHTDGRPMIIGGAARIALLAVLGMEAWAKPDDWDFTVIGGSYVSKDYRPRGSSRVEIEWEAPHPTLSHFFKTVDLSINQVAVSAQGFIFATKNAVKAWKNRVISLAHAGSATPREAVRAIRFSLEYNLQIAPSLLEDVKSFSYEDLNRMEYFLIERYSRRFENFRELLKEILG